MAPALTITEPSYAFVDADNIAQGLSQRLARANISSSDYQCFSLSEMLQAGRHDRVLVYSGANVDDEVAPWVDDIQMLDGFVVRTGRLTRKGSIVKQQGVDVKLAIDAVQHAHRGNMKSCVIYSGDGDFIPLVDALVEAGVFVTVASFANPNKGEVAPTLKAKADRYVHLDGNNFFNRCTSWWFKGGVAVGEYPVHRIPAGYKEPLIELEVDENTYVLSSADRLRLFYSQKIGGEQIGFGAVFGSQRQAKLWLQFVWPSLGAVPVWTAGQAV